jgi:hypothetical protein
MMKPMKPLKGQLPAKIAQGEHSASSEDVTMGEYCELCDNSIVALRAPCGKSEDGSKYIICKIAPPCKHFKAKEIGTK